jgi:hypothetical protein
MYGGKTVELRDVLTACDRERDRVDPETASHECESLGCLGVEPLGVVDDAEKRLRGGDLREEAEDCEPHEVAIGRLAGAHSEHDLKCLALRRRQRIDRVEHRSAQLMERRVGKFDLSFDTDRLNDSER